MSDNQQPQLQLLQQGSVRLRPEQDEEGLKQELAASAGRQFLGVLDIQIQLDPQNGHPGVYSYRIHGRFPRQ